MPISPQEAERRRKSNSEPEYKAILACIDAMLVAGGRTFAISLFRDLNVNVDDMAVGWKVHYVADWRDGDYLEFSE